MGDSRTVTVTDRTRTGPRLHWAWVVAAVSFVALLGGINALWQDAEFIKLLTDENLSNRPDLAGEFRYEP